METTSKENENPMMKKIYKKMFLFWVFLLCSPFPSWLLCRIPWLNCWYPHWRVKSESLRWFCWELWKISKFWKKTRRSWAWKLFSIFVLIFQRNLKVTSQFNAMMILFCMEKRETVSVGSRETSSLPPLCGFRIFCCWTFTMARQKQKMEGRATSKK